MPFRKKLPSSQIRPTMPQTSSEDSIGSMGSQVVLLSKAKTGALSWFKHSSAIHSSCEKALLELAYISTDDTLDALGSTKFGLTNEEAATRLKLCGYNVLSSTKPPTWWHILWTSGCDIFNLILIGVAIASVTVGPPEWSTFAIILTMILVGWAIRFWQELRSSADAVKLQDGVAFHFRVSRPGNDIKIMDQKDLVPGDVVYIDPGNTVPADCRIIQSKNLSISQSSLTGENEPQRKTSQYREQKTGSSIQDLDNIIFIGSNVISGSGLAVVLRTGDNTFIATITKALKKKAPKNSFQRGIMYLGWAMIAIIFAVFPTVLIVSWRKTKNTKEAAEFAVAVAVGLIPQLLSAIVNSNLARGAFVLRKKNAIVKCLPSTQSLGAMTVLCCDKTGTLTRDEITLYNYLNNKGDDDPAVFNLAHANAEAQSGTKNSIDTAILKHPASAQVLSLGEKCGEIAFTFEARRSSAIIKTKPGKHLLVCKGAYEEVLDLCSKIRLAGEIFDLGQDHVLELNKRVAALNSQGYRVVLVATKELLDMANDETNFDGLDNGMTIEGLLTFLDPPKADAKSSIARLQGLGIDVRVLTGDNLGVAMKICRDLEIGKEIDEENKQAISGAELAKLNDSEFHEVVKHCKVFAKLTPCQKGRVITSLKEKHSEVVGMLGDGINDGVALRYADVGISVDTGTNVAKNCADVILTEKALSIIVDCVLVGRNTQGNTIKYIKVVFASNVGNILSVLVATAWFPFQAMRGLQLLVAGLLYETSQLAIPWDEMDPEYLAVPSVWSIKDILRFIIIQGPLSSYLDIITFCLNWYYYKLRDPNNEHDVRLFQAHWYLQGLVTQVIVVHFIRTTQIPIIQSRSTKPLAWSSVLAIVVGFSFPYIPQIAKALHFERPENSFLGFLAAEVVFYAILVEISKRIQLKVFKRWL